MRTEAIIRHLAQDDGFPEDAIRAAREQRQEIAPLLVDMVERFSMGEGHDPDSRAALFFAFHLLGEWRERSAYRPLARLLAIDPEELDAVLGDAITGTSHRVMSAVFDGDPRPLHEVIEVEETDQFIRSRMLETLALLALRGELDRDEVSRYLRDGR